MNFLLKNKAKWYRVIFFGMLFMAIPALIEASWTAYWHNYYETAPISEFYKDVSFEAENLCFGNVTQSVENVRYVKGTDSGWAAYIIRELFVIDVKNEKTQVFTDSSAIFFEVIPDGINRREAAIPKDLPIGSYKWEITIIKLYLPYGVVRVTTPSLVSNLFAVKDCNT